MAATANGATEWGSLGLSNRELTLDLTLPTGQSFRWRQTGEDQYTGVIGHRVISLRQTAADVQYYVHNSAQLGSDAKQDKEVLSDYFNLSVCLEDMYVDWSARDERFRAVGPYFTGARMMRQDPLECMFSFICSSNNHISRIHGMVDRLCSSYGTSLGKVALFDDDSEPQEYFAFPTLEQLAGATDEALRADGYGYRAKFIVGSTAMLLAKEGGGDAWLQHLRVAPYEEAAKGLAELPGIGPKVAACICLFSLDKHCAIPVDTHVWQFACRYYTPELTGKSVTPKIMAVVENALIERFGEYTGWAHNILFIAELRTALPDGSLAAFSTVTTVALTHAAFGARRATQSSHRDRLPEHLRPPPTSPKPKAAGKTPTKTPTKSPKSPAASKAKADTSQATTPKQKAATKAKAATASPLANGAESPVSTPPTKLGGKRKSLTPASVSRPTPQRRQRRSATPPTPAPPLDEKPKIAVVKEEEDSTSPSFKIPKRTRRQWPTLDGSRVS